VSPGTRVALLCGAMVIRSALLSQLDSVSLLERTARIVFIHGICLLARPTRFDPIPMLWSNTLALR
jgi:hypothetical protein